VYQRWPSFLCLIAAVSAAGTGACTEANPAYRKARDARGSGAPDASDGIVAPPGEDADPGGQGEVAGPDQGPAPPLGGTGGSAAPGGQPDVAMEAEGMAETAPPVDTGRPDAAAPDLPPDVADPRPTEGLLVAFSLEKEATTRIGTDYMESDSYGNTLRTYGLTYATDVPPGAPAGSKSLQFNGTNGYAQMTLKVAPINDGAKTIAVWFKSTTSTPSPRTMVSLARLPETTNVGIQLGFDGDWLAGWRYGQNPEFRAPAVRDNWQHAAYSYTGRVPAAGNQMNVHRLYVNGALLSTSNSAMNGSNPLTRAFVGTYDPPDEMFKGFIKDLRIYDRALSDAEIQTLARRP
jgi:hypothetical protein